MTTILKSIYEPSFSSNVFGFKSEKSCHDALNYVKYQFKGSKWFINGSVSNIFENTNHHILIKIIRKRVKDERFIRLIWKALRAGFFNIDYVPQNRLIGISQNSVLSSTLFNIFLNEFDTFVTKVLVPQYTKMSNPISNMFFYRSHYNFVRYKKTGFNYYLKKALVLRLEARQVSFDDFPAKNFRRVKFVRYADDWLISFIGTLEKVRTIKKKCHFFFSKKLKLSLTDSKILITKANFGCIFLGTKVHVQNKYGKYPRYVTINVQLNVPLRNLIQKLSKLGYCNSEGISKPLFNHYAYSTEKIIEIYATLFKNIVNYYTFADNYVRSSSSIWYILRTSLSKLLAAKLKLKSSRRVILKFRGKLEVNKTTF